jgi:hypothetical protein
VADPGERGRVKVIDRRRFTTEGDLRDSAPDPAPAAAVEPAAEPARPPEPAAAPPVVEAGPHAAASAPEERGAAPSSASVPPPGEPAALHPGPGIADVVDLLAQQAMAFLSGQVPGRGRDPVTARYFIDLLAVLKDKTTGRLTLEETNFLDDVLYQLRSLYVAATR